MHIAKSRAAGSPTGFVPVQDTGIIQGISEGPQSVSFQAMAERQQALARVVLADPAVESLSSFIGVDAQNPTPNTGRMLIQLKPLAERDARAPEVIQRLQGMPGWVVDYVIVHELCHLRDRSHGESFWRLVRGVLPDYEARKAWLERNGWGCRWG